MPKHHFLHFVDLEYKTAFCSVCGPTEIYVTNSRANSKPKVFCLNRVLASKEAQKDRTQVLRHLRSNRKRRHFLSAIDVEKMTAVCAICGPTDIQKHNVRNSPLYHCATKVREDAKKHPHSNYIPQNSRPHALSEIDDETRTAVCLDCGPVPIYIWQGKRTIQRRCSNASVEGSIPAQKIRREVNRKLIDEYKVEHGCQRCGYNKYPLGLNLYARSPSREDPQMDRLLLLRRDRLLFELELYDVHCAICHRLVYRELENGQPASRILIQSAYP